VHLIPPSLLCLRLLVAGDLPAAELELGLAFRCAIWPDDAEMREGLAVHLAACEQNPRDLLWRVYLIADERNTIVGHAGFKGGPGRSGEVEIFWCVEPRWRGKGIAKGAAASLCAYAFANGAVTAITATIARQNIASQHVAAALGMEPVERELKHGLPLWRLIRDEWRPGASPLTDPAPVIAGAQPAP
jgi:RimJ/RimL family protein N-acetyltransferase